MNALGARLLLYAVHVYMIECMVHAYRYAGTVYSRSVVIDLFVLCSYSVYILLNILPAHLFNQIESVFTINSVLLGLHIIMHDYEAYVLKASRG